MNHPVVQLLLRWCVLAVGVTLATRIIHGIHYDSGGTLLVVVLLLSLFNAILKPLLLLFALPFIVMTLGVGLVVINVLVNALLFSWVGRLVDGFYVDGFWTAIGGALVVSLTSFVADRLLGSQQGPRGPRPPGGGFGGGGSSGGGFGGFGAPPRPQVKPPEKRVPPGKGDVIDI